MGLYVYPKKKEIHVSTKRDCPNCKTEINYKNKYIRNRAEKKNLTCASCSQQKRCSKKEEIERRTQDGKKLVGEKNPFFGRKHTNKTKKSISKTLKNKRTFSGSNNPMFGKTVYQLWIEKYGKEEADKKQAEFISNHSERFSGKKNPMFGKPSPKGSGNGWKGWYKNWFFRSFRELSYMIKVIEQNKFEWKSAETADLAIPYIDWKGNTRTYFADFLIDKTLVECKPTRLINSPSVSIKRIAALKFCKEKGLKYEIIDPEMLNDSEIQLLIESGQIRLTKRYQEKYDLLKKN